MKTKIFLSAVLFCYALINASFAQPLVADAGADQSICLGNSILLDGSATGGTSPYTFSWSPATGLSSPNIPNPYANPTTTTTYTLWVSDAASNTSSATVTISVNPTPNIVVTASPMTLCAGSCATITATGTINYSWCCGLGPSQSVTVCPTSTTIYTVTGSDATGCTATASVIITVEPPLLVFTTSTDETCGMANGTITANVTGGSGIYTYMWSTSPSQMTATATGLPAGTYTVTVVDADGCMSTASGTVLNTLGLVISTSGSPASCGLCNGSAVLNVSGGTGSYTYLWSNGATGQVITGLCPGIYSVTVSDGTCYSTDTVLIGNINGLSVVLDTIINANCSNNSLGSIAVHAECGSPPYSYLWSTGGPDSVITNLAMGLYTVTVVDALSDTATASFPVSSTPNIYATIITSNANCGDNGTASVMVTGSWPPFTYEWSDALHQTTATAVNLGAGAYTVTITDSLGCSLIGSTNINSNCMNIMKGRVFLDTNQNCAQDPGEAGIPNKAVYATPGYYYGYTDSLGDFTIMTPNMNNTLYAPYMPQPYSITCPSSGTIAVNFANAGDTLAGNNFGYYADSNNVDLGISATWTAARPGFNASYWIYYYNNSFFPQNVLIRFTYDSLLQYDSCTQGGTHYPAQHKIEWTVNNVAPGYYNYYYNSLVVYFYVPADLILGTLLYPCFEIFPIAGDAYPVNNTTCPVQMVTNSSDPNSKSVSPIGETTEGYITENDSTLIYTIHFQNTGNDTAFTVVVADTLSPFLDPASVVPGAASHPYTFNLSGQGILTFRFDNILLPDSSVNEPASNGYVSYTVKQKNNNPVGTVILNTAANYFDFNLPVNTNTVKNTIATTVSINEDLLKTDNIRLFPNPFHDAFTLEIGEKESYPCTVKIYNSIANTVMTKKISQPITSINSTGFKNGIYFIIVEDRNGGIVGKGKIIKQ
jgi:uncharacterized repeat protein (TIGR01451 family)